MFALCLGLFVLDKKVRSIVSIAASLCGFSGLLLGVIVTQDGHSEMYFTMSASVINKEDGFMYYGAFSERQQYLEGDRYFRGKYLEERTRRRLFIEKVFANDEDALKRIAEENIDYVIQTKRITPGFEGNSSILCLVYETSTVRIYDVVQ